MKFKQLPNESKFVAEYQYNKNLNQKVNNIVFNFIKEHNLDNKTIYFDVDFAKKAINSLYINLNKNKIGIIDGKVCMNADNFKLFNQLKELYNEINSLIKTENIDNYFFDSSGVLLELNSKNTYIDNIKY
jgi:L-rhamnose mutarotase